MTDPTPWLILLLSLPLLALAVFDVQVALELRAADRIKPVIPFLGLVKGVLYGVAVAAILAVILGIASVVFYTTGVRLLPQPIGLIIIYAICISASLAVYRLRQWIRRQ